MMSEIISIVSITMLLMPLSPEGLTNQENSFRTVLFSKDFFILVFSSESWMFALRQSGEHTRAARSSSPVAAS